MSTADFHIRMHSDLDKQVERESVLRRTSKNQLLIGIITRAMNPNPDDEASIFRRLDRVEKCIDALEKAIRALVQNAKTLQAESVALQKRVQSQLQEVLTEQQWAHGAALKVDVQLARLMRELLPQSRESQLAQLRQLLEAIAESNPSATRNLYRRLLG